VGTFARLAGERWAWMGAFVGFVATAIMFYYSVVAGWCVFYLQQMSVHPLPLETESARAIWDQFQSGGGPVIFHALAMGLGAGVVWTGVNAIERANKVLVPALLAVVVVAVIRAVSLPGAWEGLAYLFTPDWRQLYNPQLWLEALTQNAWDTGAGWGLILTYAAYMEHRHGVVQNAFLTGIGNNIVSLLAGTMVFCTVFAVLGAQMSRPEIMDVMRSSGPAGTGLTFIWMPQLFARMAFGKVLAIIFFLGLSFAAFSSLIAMIELATRTLVDFGLQRRFAVSSVAGLGFVLGLPSAVSTGFLGNQDFVWGIALIMSGGFVAFAVIRNHAPSFRRDIIRVNVSDWRLGSWWDVVITYLVPLEAAVLLGWWISLSATVYAPERWYDPFEPYSVMTCLLQWSLVLVVFLVFNRWMSRRTFQSDTSQT
jgi:NSS family neurotransmitter:Na+ symporter